MDQIEVWSADLDAGTHSESEAQPMLSPDELERAQRFRHATHRRRYILRRAILRKLLGDYLSTEPEAIRFSYNAQGKPSLSDKPLHFNVSQSDGQACFAFCSSSPVGIDIERLRAVPDFLQIAGSFCTSAEQDALTALPASEQLRAFFKCWTRKEALVKALGRGLSFPLDHFSVSLDDPARLLGASTEQPDLFQWKFHSWEFGPGFQAALATRLPESQLILRRFPANT